MSRVVLRIEGQISRREEPLQGRQFAPSAENYLQPQSRSVVRVTNSSSSAVASPRFCRRANLRKLCVFACSLRYTLANDPNMALNPVR